MIVLEAGDVLCESSHCYLYDTSFFYFVAECTGGERVYSKRELARGPFVLIFLGEYEVRVVVWDILIKPFDNSGVQ